MTDPAYLDGMSIIQRGRVAKSGRSRRPQYGWTLHRSSCPYVVRSTTAMPAPAMPYPNTINCKLCKPEGGHYLMHSRLDDGSHRSACECGAVSEGSTADAARLKMYRLHEAAKRAAPPTQEIA